MQLLRRNLKQFLLLPYLGHSTPIMDGTYRTGEYMVEYGEGIQVIGNIAPPNSGSTSFTSSGYVNTRQFGETVDYDHIILMTNKEAERCGIKEGDLLYFPQKAVYLEIKRLAVDLNITSIASKRITVSDGQYRWQDIEHLTWLGLERFKWSDLYGNQDNNS